MIDKKVTAVIAAAGSSTRMGGQNKLLRELLGKPVLAYTLLAFEKNDLINNIVICCRDIDIESYRELCNKYSIKKVSDIIEGGKSRTESVYNGVLCCKNSDIIAIADGARPLITDDVITNTIKSAIENGAAAPVIKLKDSIKKVQDGKIIENVERQSVMIVQTPQVFNTIIIKTALKMAIKENYELTDDCSAVEKIGVLVTAVNGSNENIKITTEEDIVIAEAFLKNRQKEKGECSE